MCKKVAIVTGASSGLGREFARQVDKVKGIDEIWLIARRQERLVQLAAELKTATRVLALDLLQENSFEIIASELNQQKPVVSILINNAGKGKAGRFTSLERDYNDEVLKLNVLAIMQLTNIVLPFCAPGSRILQISSVAAFMPQPGFSVYAASKAFVLSFARALNEELRREKITVTAVCPNPMETEFFNNASGKSKLNRIKSLGIEKPEHVVRVALERSARGKDVSVSCVAGKLLRLVGKFLPNRVIMRVISKMGY
ncbi:MAG: SDR family NAD(P)-dependent oxidoreductase [Saccharofermentanales bacterium]|jgi:short-subunit dehydrogenase|nr:SDR family NAD(P)-dependent oxidoreductase [Bacillota bacterium]NLB09272.1 SDR family NAD(P)-dependent oxidoreductase [Clostridiales bacterium]